MTCGHRVNYFQLSSLNGDQPKSCYFLLKFRNFVLKKKFQNVLRGFFSNINFLNRKWIVINSEILARAERDCCKQEFFIHSKT